MRGRSPSRVSTRSASTSSSRSSSCSAWSTSPCCTPDTPPSRAWAPTTAPASTRCLCPATRRACRWRCCGAGGPRAAPCGCGYGPRPPPLHNSTALDCREHAPCQLALDLPFWQHWYYVLVERHPGVPGTVSFQVIVQLTDCSRPSLSRPPFLPSSASMNMPHSFGSAGGLGLGADSPPPASPNGTRHPLAAVPSAAERCWPVRPTLRNELDTFSVHFYIFFGPNVSVPPDRPAVFVINLLPVLDSGGVLNLELRLNVSSLRGENATVFGCLNHEVPLASSDNASVTCETESLAGFLLSVNATASLSRLRIPYPQTGSWYLSLRSLCATEHGFEPCTNVTAEVYLRAYLSPCINDCGIYGQCKLLRTNNYLYAACECKAGWNGWGCTDNAEAFSYGFQLLSTLLLCLSNVMFVPPVAIAVRSHYLLEAAVYIFTMFFSTFYHACDQPGIVVFCIMDYDVLQFCDFLGSLMSVWVTVIAMARLQPVVKQVLYLLGAMLLSMALQMDRHGLWNLLGPSLFALGIMAIAWTARTIRRRHCYPPTWKRWAFYLCPGALIAAGAVLLYAFVETEENYFYIHSIWHLLIAGSVGFLLPPPRQTRRAPGAAAPPQGLRVPALRQRAGGAGAGRPRRRLHQQHLHRVTAPPGERIWGPWGGGWGMGGEQNRGCPSVCLSVRLSVRPRSNQDSADGHPLSCPSWHPGCGWSGDVPAGATKARGGGTACIGTPPLPPPPAAFWGVAGGGDRDAVPGRSPSPV
uniref:Transmembrane protein 8B n=1 Tax=Anas platyrhynchos platyrhynchos TaxID=8840 RepID=A0A493TBA3_ANAPP